VSRVFIPLLQFWASETRSTRRGTPTLWESRLISVFSRIGTSSGQGSHIGFRPHLVYTTPSLEYPNESLDFGLRIDNTTVQYYLHQCQPMIHRIISPTAETQKTQRSVTYSGMCRILSTSYILFRLIRSQFSLFGLSEKQV
jgi:hypothetical protein